VIEQKRYAVVSCHVERVFDDRTWRLFSRLQEQTPAGFRIAALLRPPDRDAGEARETWLKRARAAAARGPLGHHTHWGGPEQARPRFGKPDDRVRREGSWLRSVGLQPTLFCGGGWYIDAEIAEIAASLDYIDCTGTTFRATYLAAQEPQLSVSGPCWLKLPSGRHLLELPTTHSLGMLARALVRPGGFDEPLVHVYFHDTDLLNRRRARALRTALTLLASRRVSSDLDRVATELRTQELPVHRLSGARYPNME
jgi:hypothetical protein